jgi:hypothetical protein
MCEAICIHRTRRSTNAASLSSITCPQTSSFDDSTIFARLQGAKSASCITIVRGTVAAPLLGIGVVSGEKVLQLFLIISDTSCRLACSDPSSWLTYLPWIKSVLLQNSANVLYVEGCEGIEPHQLSPPCTRPIISRSPTASGRCHLKLSAYNNQ